MNQPMKALSAALVKAQSEFHDPAKDSKNPHFKSKFVSLKGVLDAVRGPLHKHGIAIVQEIDFAEGQTYVRTRLLHESGESLESRCPVVCAKDRDPQAMGSAITYARRYAAAAICGVAPADDDDDGNEAARPTRQRAAVDDAPRKAPPFDTVEDAIAAIGEAKSALALDVIGKRIKDSGFQGSDRESAAEAYKERRAIMAETA